MALTQSNMMALGTTAPDFNLPEPLTGKTRALADLKSEVATVVMFICNHCPYVVHVNQRLVEVSNLYASRGIQFVGISSNSVQTHPQDGPEQMAEHARTVGYGFPYLYDETQEVAKAYQAACTPDFYVFDAGLRCVYRGRFDETRPGQGEAHGGDLTAALDALLAGRPIAQEQIASMGCNIKWH